MSRTTEHIVIGLVEKPGYSIIPSWRLEGRELARHLAQIFDRYAITTVFDVGANVGQYHDFLRQQVGFSGKVLSFEPQPQPQPQPAQSLRHRQAADPVWETHNLGFGNSDSELALNVMARDTFSSFRQPAADASLAFSSSN